MSEKYPDASKTFCYFAPSLKYASKIILSTGLFLTFFNPMFANCVHVNTPTSAFLFTSERENTFLPNCSKFAAKCEWNSKNSQNVQNLGFSRKNRWVFRKRNLENFQNRYIWRIFSRTRLKLYFFSKMSFHLVFEVFWQKSKQI